MFKEKEHYKTKNDLTVYVLHINKTIYGRLFHKDTSVTHENWFLDGTEISGNDDLTLIPNNEFDDVNG